MENGRQSGTRRAGALEGTWRSENWHAALRMRSTAALPPHREGSTAPDEGRSPVVFAANLAGLMSVRAAARARELARAMGIAIVRGRDFTGSDDRQHGQV